MVNAKLEVFKKEIIEAAASVLAAIEHNPQTTTVVHHNDADGLCAAAALLRVFKTLSLPCCLLPVEKIHELIVEKIHDRHQGVVFYADLGGQSSHLIGRHAAGNRLVVIVDHHLPGGKTPAQVVHLNPEHFGIDGDTEASGAAVSAYFAEQLLRRSGVESAAVQGELALFAVLGAYGDGQFQEMELLGLNKKLLAAAIANGYLRSAERTLVVPTMGARTVAEITDILNLLGSVGFQESGPQVAVRFLLGEDQGLALQKAANLAALREQSFEAELQRIRQGALQQSVHVQWLDVRDRFLPMGVKAIGLFLERLIAEQLVKPDKYLVGFQHFPESVPGVGEIGLVLTKVSARVPPALKRRIIEGLQPDLMHLLPEATRIVGGTADGCHRFSAASLVERGKEEAFVAALEQALILEVTGR
ncbi:MAG: DHH family phosphoesterase [Deltaproteobacteria bacterium]|nr:DHH family phosphoesterase [Deltaproteobacteria bacterium]MBW2069949.1 DHH family phosphoesterase [Deltaproteobacteria bacterium]